MVRVASDAVALPPMPLRAEAGRNGAPIGSTTSPAESAPRRDTRRTSGTTGSPSSPPLSNEQQFTLAVALGGALDPMTAMMAMQTSVRDARTRAGEASSESASRRSEGEDAERMKSLKAAEEHLAKLLNQKLPDWAKKLIAAVMIIVAAVASVFTGGASMVLVAAAAVLLVAAAAVEKLAKEGKIDGKAGMITAVVLKLVAAVLMAVAGNAGGLAQAGSTAATVVQATQVIATCVSTAQQAHEARFQMTNAVHTYRADGEQIDAEEHGLNSEVAMDDMEAAIEAMKKLRTRFARISRRMHAVQEARGQSLSVAARAIA